AIAMTDDKICWIDDVNYKYTRAYEQSKQAGKQPSAAAEQLTPREQFLRDFKVDADDLAQAVKTGIKVYGDVKNGDKSLWESVSDIWSSKDNKLKIELPRILSLIDPVFSLKPLKDKDSAILPEENFLNGNNIRLKFDYEPKDGDTIPLYIYSDYINLKITLKFTGGKPSVESIERVKN
ncbi:MAG: hypothetical protein MJY90_07985, partial [Bacteroidaceae bacterium]|nr:hypothetical protein [Bacteroidaceae bacterium]